MRILIINEFAAMGGAEIQTFREWEYFNKKGHDVYVLTFDDNNPEILKGKELNYPVKWTNMRKFVIRIFGNKKIQSEIQKIVCRISPDVIHFNNAFRSYRLTFPSIKDIPAIQTIRDYGAVCPNGLCVHPDKTICNDYQCLGKCTRQRLQTECINNPFDFSIIENIETNKIKTTTKKYLYYGLIVEHKKIQQMVQAFSVFSKDKEDRTRGLNGDPNRAGIFIVLCLFILIEFAKPSLLKKISIMICCIMILFTISRTAILCLAILLVFNIYKIKYITNDNVFKFLIGCVITVAVMMWLLTLPTIKNAFDIIISRFTNRQEESAVTHVSLIGFGIEKVFSNLKYLLVGNGYGASYTILRNFFGNNKYANFHNGYVTFLVECGLISLVSFVLVMLQPLFKNKKCIPFVMIIALANVSYQLHTEQYIWMFIPILCLPIFSKEKDNEERLLYETRTNSLHYGKL